jgi:ribosomal protein S6
MPSYEAAMILKKMANPQTAAALKRVAQKIMDNNGILFEIQNLGTRNLPFKMASHGHKHMEGR